MDNKMIIMKESGYYPKPGEKESDLFSSGKKLQEKYPEYYEFLDPALIGIIRDIKTGEFVEKIFYKENFMV